MAYGFNDDKTRQELVDAVYPVGSIYMSVNSANPSTLFGGTWVAWGTGRVPVGIDTAQTEFNTVEKTGGSKTHTLTVDQIPSHRHGGVQVVNLNDANVKQGSGATVVVHSNSTITTSYTGYAGGGKAHNILQPYITCYMWKRTA